MQRMLHHSYHHNGHHHLVLGSIGDADGATIIAISRVFILIIIIIMVIIIPYQAALVMQRVLRC